MRAITAVSGFRGRDFYLINYIIFVRNDARYSHKIRFLSPIQSIRIWVFWSDPAPVVLGFDTDPAPKSPEIMVINLTMDLFLMAKTTINLSTPSSSRVKRRKILLQRYYVWKEHSSIRWIHLGIDRSNITSRSWIKKIDILIVCGPKNIVTISLRFKNWIREAAKNGLF